MLVTKISSSTFRVEVIAFKDCQQPVTAFSWAIPNFSCLWAQTGCFSFAFNQPAVCVDESGLASSHRKHIICTLNSGQTHRMVHKVFTWPEAGICVFWAKFQEEQWGFLVLGGCQAGCGSYEPVLRAVSDAVLTDTDLEKWKPWELKFSCRCPRAEITALSLLFPLGSGC